MSIRVEEKRVIRITNDMGYLTLGQLRDFVEYTKEYAEDAEVLAGRLTDAMDADLPPRIDVMVIEVDVC